MFWITNPKVKLTNNAAAGSKASELDYYAAKCPKTLCIETNRFQQTVYEQTV